MSSASDGAAIALDVRPVLARGEEPFAIIMEAAGRVPAGGALELTAPFEPVPLYGVLSGRGFGHVTTPLPGGAFRVRFVQTGITPAATVEDVHARYPGTGGVFMEHGIDLCCGGGQTLEFTAKAHKLDLARLLAQVQQAAVATE